MRLGLSEKKASFSSILCKIHHWCTDVQNGAKVSKMAQRCPRWRNNVQNGSPLPLVPVLTYPPDALHKAAHPNLEKIVSTNALTSLLTVILSDHFDLKEYESVQVKLNIFKGGYSFSPVPVRAYRTVS